MREAFGYLPDPHSKDPVDLHMLLKKMHTIRPGERADARKQCACDEEGGRGPTQRLQTIREGNIRWLEAAVV